MNQISVLWKRRQGNITVYLYTVSVADVEIFGQLLQLLIQTDSRTGVGGVDQTLHSSSKLEKLFRKMPLPLLN